MQDNQAPTPTSLDSEPPTQPIQVVQPAAPENIPVEPPKTSLGVIVLGWLSYAFWGWLILALIWAVAVIAAAALTGLSTSDLIPYVIAATLVLLPVAFFTDMFYRKYEPSKKSGALGVVAIIHAVLFAVLGIGALIVMVFAVVNALVDGGGLDSDVVVSIITALSAVALYAAVFVRTLNPFKTMKYAKIYALSMLAVTIVLVIATIVGPAMQEAKLRDSTAIEEQLRNISTDIRSYASDNNRLPATLADVSSLQESEMKEFIDDNSVTYEIERSFDQYQRYERYQLCVVYEDESPAPKGYDRYNDSSYSTTLPVIRGHAKGNVCYKLQVYVTPTSSEPSMMRSSAQES